MSDENTVTGEAVDPARRKRRPATPAAKLESEGADYARGVQIGELRQRVGTVEKDVKAIGTKLDDQSRDMTSKLEQQGRDFDGKLDSQTKTLTAAIDARFQPLSSYITHQQEAEARKAEEDARKEAAYQKAELVKKTAAEKRDKKADQQLVIGITVLGSLAATELPPLFTAVAGVLPSQQMVLVRGLVVAAILVAVFFAVRARNSKGDGGKAP